jgi:hypothetical protein
MEERLLPKFTKNCVWCNAEYEFVRSSKVTCSDACSIGFKRWVAKLNINNTTAFAYLDAIKMFGGKHPNRKYGEANEIY